MNNMIHETYVTYMSSVKETVLGLYLSYICEIPCWQQQMECDWNAKLQNCGAYAQEYWASWHL